MVKINSLEHGRQLLAEIRQERAKLQELMTQTSGAEWQKLVDDDYDLRTYSRQIQNEMTKIVKAKRVPV